LVLVQNFEVDLEQVCGWWFLLVWSHDEVDRFWGERFVGGVEGGGRRGGEGGGRGGGEHWIAGREWVGVVLHQVVQVIPGKVG